MTEKPNLQKLNPNDHIGNAYGAFLTPDGAIDAKEIIGTDHTVLSDLQATAKSYADLVAEQAENVPLFDMHCHLNFADNLQGLLPMIAKMKGGFFSTTVTPTDYLKGKFVLGRCPGVRNGLGLHPWWLADGRATLDDVARFEELAAETSYIGEVGMDFSEDHQESIELQKEAFDRIVQASCASGGGKLMSIHAVQSVPEVLDTLEKHNCTDTNVCIIHWYSGSSDQLKRAIDMGCYFSVNLRMMATKKGREYARVIPVKRLLLETDLPPKQAGIYNLHEHMQRLRNTLEMLAEIREENPNELGFAIAETSRMLLGL